MDPKKIEDAMGAPPVAPPAPEQKMAGPDGKPGGPAKPGTYKADGDPYTYKLNHDGSVTIQDGPTGSGSTLASGRAYDAIVSQMVSGVLKQSAPAGESLKVGPDGKPGGPAKPGTYAAAGDPYTYKLNDDGSVTIVSGPSGAGKTMASGPAYDSILEQILSGQLKSGGSMRDRLSGAVDDAMAFTTPISDDDRKRPVG